MEDLNLVSTSFTASFILSKRNAMILAMVPCLRVVVGRLSIGSDG